MIRRLFVGILVLGVFMPTAGPASADPPTQFRITEASSFVLPASDFCGSFDVQVDALQKFKVIIFSGDRGTWFDAISAGGPITAVLTNLSTGTAISVNIPGPGFYDANGNLLVGTGPWLIFVPGAILYIHGRAEYVQEPFGDFPEVVHGIETDLCASLA